MAEFPLPVLQIWRSRKRVAIQIQLMNIHVSECKYYCLHLVPKFGDMCDRQNWRLHPTVICTWRIREWELQILNWSSSVQPEIVPLFTISFQCLKKKFKSWQVYDWLAKWLIMSGYMDLRRPRVYRRSNVGLVGEKIQWHIKSMHRTLCFLPETTREIPEYKKIHLGLLTKQVFSIALWSDIRFSLLQLNIIYEGNKHWPWH